MAANSSVYFLRFPFADESEILSGFSFMNESSKKYVIILIILDKLRFIIKNKITVGTIPTKYEIILKASSVILVNEYIPIVKDNKK